MIISFNVMFVVMMSHSFLFLKNKFFLFFFFQNCVLQLHVKSLKKTGLFNIVEQQFIPYIAH